MKRVWSLWLSTGVKSFSETRASLIDIVATDKEVKQKMLDHLKKVLRRRKNHRHIHAMLFPDTPRKGEKDKRTEDIIRVKDGFSNRKLLRIKDPEQVLVQGYGPEALKELGR